MTTVSLSLHLVFPIHCVPIKYPALFIHHCPAFPTLALLKFRRSRCLQLALLPHTHTLPPLDCTSSGPTTVSEYVWWRAHYMPTSHPNWSPHDVRVLVCHCRNRHTHICNWRKNMMWRMQWISQRREWRHAGRGAVNRNRAYTHTLTNFRLRDIDSGYLIPISRSTQMTRTNLE